MLIILDRDGVINFESHEYVKSPDEWIPIPGSLEAIARLTQAGHHVVVATNQSGVGRGHYSLDTMHRIHDKMHDLLAELGGKIEEVYYCPHHPDDGCDCRKPEPGMLLEIKNKYPDEFGAAIFVGDSLRDIQAAQTAGCLAALVKTGNGEQTIKTGEGLKDIPIYNDLNDFVNSFLT